MNTKEVAHRLVTMCRQGQYMEAVNELYCDTISSQEMPGYPDALISGKENVQKKGQEWMASVEAFHSAEISEPMIAGNHFIVKMDLDITFKEKGRQKLEEACVYQVKDGKIVNEQFFYDMPEM